MQCHHCARIFRAAPSIIKIGALAGDYCSDNCIEEAIESADNKPCHKCKQYHSGQCNGKTPKSFRRTKNGKKAPTHTTAV